MKLIYVRHGETDWNTLKKLQGWTDIPLNEKGREQARKTCDLLKEYTFDRIVCSPLLRAKQTAEIINEERQVPLIVDERIRERGFGTLEGSPFTQADFAQWWKSNFDCSTVGMEPMSVLFARVAALIDELQEKYPEETVLLVSHGGAFVAVDGYFNGYPQDGEEMRFLPNCTVREFSVKR